MGRKIPKPHSRAKLLGGNFLYCASLCKFLRIEFVLLYFNNRYRKYKDASKSNYISYCLWTNFKLWLVKSFKLDSDWLNNLNQSNRIFDESIHIKSNINTLLAHFMKKKNHLKKTHIEVNKRLSLITWRHIFKQNLRTLKVSNKITFHHSW